MFHISATGRSATLLLPRMTGAVRSASSSTCSILQKSTLQQFRKCRTLPVPQSTLRFFQHTTRSPARHQNSKPKLPAAPKPNTPSVSEETPRLLDRLREAGQLSGEVAPPLLTTSQRLLRPFLFTALVIGGSLYYAYSWAPTPQNERWFPTVPVAFATVSTIIALNTAVFVAWRIPLPITWRTLNRFFITVPAVPYSASMLGSAFSHQSLTHLGVNMFVLYIFGTSLCEQIGQGAFIGLYLSGGVASSFASLAYNVARANFHVSSLGASGAIAALIGAFAYLNPDNEVYVIFLPFLALKAKYFVPGVAAMEAFAVARGWQYFDHIAHLGGLLWGGAFGVVLMKEVKRRKELVKKRLGWR